MSGCFWAFDCTSSPPRLAVCRLSLDLPDGDSTAALSRASWVKAIGKVVTADGSASLHLPPPGGAGAPACSAPAGRAYSLHVNWRDDADVTGADGAMSTDVAHRGGVVQVRLRPLRSDLPTLSATASAGTQGPYPQRVLVGVEAAWQVLWRMRQLDRGSDRQLIWALRDTDARLQHFAVDRLGERHARLAVKPLCKMLAQHEGTPMRYPIIGALVAIGDARAVPALIDVARQKEPAFVSQVAFAVAALGGRVAQAYLVVLASGHPDEIVAASARDALEELLQHAATARR